MFRKLLFPFWVVPALATAGALSPLTRAGLSRFENVSARSLERIIVVVPAHRELLNGNLFRLLSSVASQITPKAPLRFDVVLLINDFGNVAPAVHLENVETVKWLQSFQSGSPSELKLTVPNKTDWSVLARKKLNLHVLDYTGTQYANLTIGEKRDLANQYALSLVPQSASRFTAIAQMDADCQLPIQYGATAQAYFSNPLRDFLLMDLELWPLPGSLPVLFDRWIYDELSVNYQQTSLAMAGKLPNNSTPRIIVRADVMKAIGQYPLLAYAEDCALIRKLSAGYKGAHVFEAPIRVGHRGREDSFDAAYILKGAAEEKSISPKLWELADEILRYEEGLKRENFGDWERYEAEYQYLIDNHRRSAQWGQAQISKFVTEGNTKVPLHEVGSFATGIFLSDWFSTYLQRERRDANSNVELMIQRVAHDFPHLLDTEPSMEIELNARFTAYRRSLLHSANLRENPEVDLSSHCGQEIANRESSPD